ncbi:hypothetical protein J6590_103972 [Homalodisca vitripennis]|nr:hypothetical protein J6590_103972 [Homalodisca vitripennis]
MDIKCSNMTQQIEMIDFCGDTKPEMVYGLLHAEPGSSSLAANVHETVNVVEVNSPRCVATAPYQVIGASRTFKWRSLELTRRVEKDQVGSLP